MTAVNDNIFRWFVIGVGKKALPVSEHTWVISQGLVFFVAPYLILASIAGWLADRFEKRKVIIACKIAEIVAMALGVFAVYLGDFYFLLFTVSLMGAQSALFAPAKVGTIPELLDESTISAGNGLFNLATLSATIIGMSLGAVLSEATVGGTQDLHIAGATLVGIAVIGTVLAFFVYTRPAANPKKPFPWTIIGDTIIDVVRLARMGRLFRVSLGISFFWTVGALAQLYIDQLSDEGGALLETERTPLLICVVLGIGLGSVLAGLISAGRIELGLVPWGALGIALFSMAVLFVPDYFLLDTAASWKIAVVCILLAGIGVSAGFFDVPLASYLQQKSPIETRGSILSATNFMIFAGMAIATQLFDIGFRAPTEFGKIESLPPEFQASELSESERKQIEVMKQKYQAEVASYESEPTETTPEKNAISLDIKSPLRLPLITELVWSDIERQRALAKQPEELDPTDAAPYKFDTAKYEQLFPQDKRQVKIIVRQSAKQPWLTARQIFFVIGLMTVPIVAYSTWRLPQKMARILFWCVLNLFYKTRVRGLENVPEKGGAVLAFNHCSWLDGVTILSLQPRKARAIAWSGNFKSPLMKWWAGFCGVILISGGPKSIRRGLEEAKTALQNGELVAIFPEGGITQTGQIRSVKPGLMKILEGTDIPVVPCYIDEMWGSIFSYKQGKAMNRFPSSIRRPLSMHFGKPIIPDSKFEVWQAMQRISTDSVNHQAGKFVSAPKLLIKNLKKRKFSMKIGDSTGQSEKGGTLLTKVLVLRRLLRKFVIAKDEIHVGVLIPPSNGGAIVNLALALDRRVAINLNYSLSEEMINECIQQAGIKHVLTSRKVMEKFEFNLDAEVVYLEDFREKISPLDKAWSAIQSFVVPASLLTIRLGLNRIKPNDLMTIIFTSGSTGTPKGVMLSHRNIVSNMRAIDQAAGFGPTDTMIGILPFFHSFGYTATLWAGIACDMRVAYHFSPLDAKQVGKLAQRYNGTILVATPTFLRSYMKRCTPEEFESLDIVVAGAERLPPELSDAFEDKFGVRPVEGYGATELSPITSVNIPKSRQYDSFQIDDKEGTVGRTLTQVSCKVTDLDSGEELSCNESGMLWIKGPNVMLGYLGRDELTKEAIVDGWYKTGDVAEIDEDGFIKITGRMSRFSKIGGEMVPHVKIEEILTRLCDDTPNDQADNDQPNVAVTAVPDTRKGERLIVLYTTICTSVDELRKGLSDAGLPNIFIPSSDSFRQVDALPLLGSGKLDLKGLKQMALDLFQEE